jgi:hypothetical protein
MEKIQIQHPPGSGMKIPDLIFENFEWYQLFGLKILKFFEADPDPGSCQPGSGMEEVGSGINIPDLQHCCWVEASHTFMTI